MSALRRVIVNADDFGQSTGVNRGIIEAHEHGIVTSASLMVTGDAYDEAVALAHENPRLGVGLHLTLICGRACLASQEIPGLATDQGLFPDNPVDAGVKYFFKQSLRPQLEREIAAQIRKFETTGLAC